MTATKATKRVRTPPAQMRPKMEAVLQLIRRGRSQNQAAAAAGISQRTIANWAARSEAFRDRLMEAEASFAGVCLDAILGAAQSKAPNTWTAAAWLLERRWPEQYGQRTRLDVTVDVHERLRRMAEESGRTYEDVLAQANEIVAEEVARHQATG